MNGNQLGDTLRELRLQKNMNQKQIAMDLNLSAQAYSNYECGKRFPSPDILCRMARYHGVTLDELLSTGLHPKQSDPFETLPPEYQQVIRSYHELPFDKQRIILDLLTVLKEQP